MVRRPPASLHGYDGDGVGLADSVTLADAVLLADGDAFAIAGGSSGVISVGPDWVMTTGGVGV